MSHDRFAPKVKSAPLTAPAAPTAPASHWATKSVPDSAAKAGSKAKTKVASTPNAANRSSFWSVEVSANGGRSGRKARAGCGSNVATSAGRPSLRARPSAAPTTA